MKLIEAIGIIIKNLLKEKSMTQYKLSRITGVSESTISMILSKNVKTIKISTLYDICCGFEMDLSDFFNCELLKNNNLDD